MRSLALALLVAFASPARAEIAPDVARSMAICATPGQRLDDTAAQLADLGWTPVQPQDHQRFGRALAPYDMVVLRGFGMLGDWDPATADRQLSRSAERASHQLGRGLPYIVTLIREAGEVMQLTAGLDADMLGLCILVLPGSSPEDISDALDTPLADRSRTPLIYHSNYSAESAGPVTVDWLGFAPDAFVEAAPDPLVLLAPARVAD